MGALSELFDHTTLIVPCGDPINRRGEVFLQGCNLSVVPLTAPGGRGLVRKVGLAFWLVRNLPVIIRELLTADAVHAPIPGDIGTIGMLLAFVLRKPLFVRHCGNWLRPVTSAEHFWKWFMEKFAGGKQVMLATGGSPNPASSKNHKISWIFSTSLREEELKACQVHDLQSSHAPKLIIACRQDRKKGTGLVIESLPLILKSFPHASLDVVGDGMSLPEFQAQAESLDVSDRVTFHGRVDHEAVVSLLNQADLFCYPTTASEGFPKVVLEAMACGLPVITTRVSVLPDLIGSGGGLLLDEATASDVAEAVVKALSDRDRYRIMSQRAIETAAQFSLERWRDTIGSKLQSAWGKLKSGEQGTASVTPAELDKPRVCFLAGTLGRGGAERQLVHMLQALKNAGAQVRVLCLTKGEPLEHEILEMGVTVTWVGESRWRPTRLYRIFQELRRYPPHVLQSSHFYTNLYVAVVAWLLGIKSIGAIRNDLTSELKANGVMGWGQLHLPGHLIANSKLARERAITKGITPHHIHMIPNAVAVNGFRKQVNGNGSDTVRILFAGRLTEQKRVDRFLYALSKMASAHPDLDFKGIVAGGGPLQKQLEQMADSLSLRPRRVEFLGELSNLKTAYQQSDLMVLTSEWEGTPNVLLEAMSCALPIVATRVGGVPDIVEHNQTGLLVNPDDIDSLTQSILSFCLNASLRWEYGQRARKYVATHHSADALRESLQQLYTNVCFEL
jgi:glycosyltransferase involved in cell wall biosynthesis